MKDFKEINFTELLLHLQPDTQPLWGSMTAQNMIEHLTETLQISNGTKMLKMPDVPEHIFDNLRKFLVGKNEFPRGFVSPLAGTEPAILTHDSLTTAIIFFLAELEKYANFWTENPNVKFFSPTFGNLNMEQWDKFHQKHFTHHFMQFKLLKS